MTKQINYTQAQTTQAFGNAIVFDIELLTGEKSAINVIHNNRDIDFEEIVAYMVKAIEKTTKIKTMEASAGSIRKGIYEPIFFYQKREFDRSEVLNNPYLRKFYDL